MTETATAPIELTPKAVTKIRQTFEKQGVSGFLRLGILGGGCSGLSYQFKFDTKMRPTDKLFEYDGGVKVIVDPKSYLYLAGLTLDYKETLMQSGFEFTTPTLPKTADAALPLPDSRYFELFGLEPALHLDQKDLEQRYFRLSRQWHPDLFARKSATQQQEALDQTAQLNDAYRTLKKPNQASGILHRPR